jgi:hypothetical protein
MELLSQENINDKFIVQYLQGLLSLTNIENTHYETCLVTFVNDLSLKEQALLGERLSANEVAMLKELMHTNMAEYIGNCETSSQS